LFNHDKYHGKEAVVCIGGLAYLNTKILFKDNTHVTIHNLLKGFPSSTGMSRPFLFQHIESNSSGMVVMGTYQKEDNKFMKQRQTMTESKI